VLHFKTILHPTDFSAPSNHAWRLACCLARDHGAKLILAHVRPLSTTLYATTSMIPDELSEMQVRQQLQDVWPTDSKLTVDRYLLDGDPSEALVEFLEENPADLVVMGSHGRTGITAFVMGSVASDLVRRAPCPVLIVKQPVPETVDDPAMELEPALV
jgi:nucleotide-binding universal stress UspA family protein